MPWLARYLGRWIRKKHSGWYPDRKVRLYNRQNAAWQGDYVHESVQTFPAPVGHLENDLLHFTCDSLSQHLRTLDRYTTLAAQSVVVIRKASPFRRLVVDPPWTFVRSYFSAARLPRWRAWVCHCHPGWLLHLCHEIR